MSGPQRLLCKTLRSGATATFFSGTHITKLSALSKSVSPDVDAMREYASALAVDFASMSEAVAAYQAAGFSTPMLTVHCPGAVLRALEHGQRGIVEVRIWDRKHLSSHPGVPPHLARLSELAVEQNRAFFSMTAPPHPQLAALLLPRKIGFFGGQSSLESRLAIALPKGFHPSDVAPTIQVAASHTTESLIADASLSRGGQAGGVSPHPEADFLGGAELLEGSGGLVDTISDLRYAQDMLHVIRVARKAGCTVIGVDQGYTGGNAIDVDANLEDCAKATAKPRLLFVVGGRSGLPARVGRACSVVVKTSRTAHLPPPLFLSVVMRHVSIQAGARRAGAAAAKANRNTGKRHTRRTETAVSAA